MTKMHKKLTSSSPSSPATSNTNNNDHLLLFPPLTYSRWTQWLLKDTSEDCIIHHSHPTAGTSPLRSSSGGGGGSSSSSRLSPPINHQQQQQQTHHKRNNMELIQLLAINALEFTAPVYSFLNKSPPDSSSPTENHHIEESKKQLVSKTSTELKLEREFIQLSGHQGTFAPAGPNSLWKKMPPDSHQEADIYTHLKSTPADPFTKHIPHFISHTNYNHTDFIELEDLITLFSLKSLSIMDIKLGTRTFLESEVSNTKPRSDLYDKMYKIDPTAFTREEDESKSVTKLRYMQFREELSSTTDLGFRIEGVKLSGDQQMNVNFQRLKDETTISSILARFTAGFRTEFRKKLLELRSCLESSEFFKTHEMIGSSLLLIHDQNRCGVWIIDFAKTFKSSTPLDHRSTWKIGNRADGVLTGIDNLIRLT
ncbi:inositol-trisphosphate 3-kinase homolog [Folsomia candida]|nr:inositol-trisphosphate 3-kinase homolog [Folsomia candida]